VIKKYEWALTPVLYLSAVHTHVIVVAGVETADLEQTGSRERRRQERIARCRDNEILSRTVPDILE
jgi:hypothetical protein